MKCPKCGAANPEGAAECVSCGVIFAKLKAIQEREKAQAKAALENLEKPAAKPAAEPAESAAVAGPEAAAPAEPAGPVIDLTGGEKPSPVRDPYLGRKIGAAIVIAWLGVFGVYYWYAVKAARARALKTPVKDRETVLMRDPVTGELKAVPVVLPASKNER